MLVSDVTEILFCGAKAYLGVHLDQFRKMLWEWRLSASASVGLVLGSFHRATRRIHSVAGNLRGLMVHQDRGSVHSTDTYLHAASVRGCPLSCSRRGEPRDNGVNEAFFSRLKAGWADVSLEARSFGELQRLVSRVIAYHNKQRYHSSPGYRTPLSFLNEFLTSHQLPVQAVS